MVLANEPAEYPRTVLNAINKKEKPVSERDLLAMAEKHNPPLVKYLHRALREGLSGMDAVKDAMRRLEESRRTAVSTIEKVVATDQPSRAVALANRPQSHDPGLDKEILGLRRQAAPGLWADEGFTTSASGYLGAPTSAQIISLSSPLAGLINNIPAIMKNPRYMDYFLQNFGHALPIPYAATDAVANKTVGVRGSVSEAITVGPGKRVMIIPTPDHYHNAPYIIMEDPGGGAPYVLREGTWYGGISPQGLMGPSPSLTVKKSVDDRSLQFKGGLAEVNVAVAYNQSCIVGHLDPFATMGYGMAMGLLQSMSMPLGVATGAYSSQYREYPYFSEEPAVTNFTELMNMAVKTTLIGSSQASGVSYRQIIRPYAHSFACAVDLSEIMGGEALAWLGYPTSLLDPSAGAAASYAQGMYLVDNSAGDSAVAVDLKMEMAFRVRVDNQAPAIYMSADTETVPKHSIEFRPTTVVAANSANAAALQRAVHSAKAEVRAITIKPANPNHMGDAVAAIKQHEKSIIDKISDVVDHVPVVGGGVAKALRGGERIATASDAGDVFAGLLDVGKGIAGAVGSLFGL